MSSLALRLLEAAERVWEKKGLAGGRGTCVAAGTTEKPRALGLASPGCIGYVTLNKTMALSEHDPSATTWG